jgi:hypothetical protein
MISTDRRGIRNRLVAIALEWQDLFGVAPAVTNAISEFDAAVRLVGMTTDDYRRECGPRTAVTRGHDFVFKGCRYQIKANRPSGKPGSFVRIVAKPKKFVWDKLIWILYDRNYVMQEAWQWTVKKYRAKFEFTERLSPAHMRQGSRIYPSRD